MSRVINLHNSVPVPTTGVHSTCSIRSAPAASITSRSKPSAMPARLRHMRERVEKILVDRIGLAIDALARRHLRFEAAALLCRVGQFAKAIGDFDAADIKFESLGETRIASQCRRASAASLTG